MFCLVRNGVQLKCSLRGVRVNVQLERNFSRLARGESRDYSPDAAQTPLFLHAPRSRALSFFGLFLRGTLEDTYRDYAQWELGNRLPGGLLGCDGESAGSREYAVCGVQEQATSQRGVGGAPPPLSSTRTTALRG